MTALVSFAILLFGVVAFRALPVAALPSVDYPTIQVQAGLPGANPETMASSVATPLERELSTIAGIESMSSTQLAGKHPDHGSVCARSQHRCRRAGCAIRHLKGRWTAASDASAAFLPEGKSR